MELMFQPFRKYWQFSGRARRKELWMFLLLLTAVNLVLLIMDNQLGMLASQEIGGVSRGLWFLATVVPLVSLIVRRLHDMGHRGWWILLLLVLYLAASVLFIMLEEEVDWSVEIIAVLSIVFFLFIGIRRGTVGDNRFGVDPLENL